MQRIDIANLVCSTVGQTDAASLAACNLYIQRRYQLIYDAFNWRDAQQKLASNLTDTVNGILAMPTGIDRIIAIRASGDHILVPFDSPLAMQLDPQVFERSDVPVAYEEFVDVTVTPNVRNIRFVPIPSSVTPLLIIGKLTADTLANDTDTPRLRNIDNTLIAYVSGNMLERQRQYAKAQAKFQEAATLLKEAIAVETEQAGYMPRVVPAIVSDYWDELDSACAITK